MRHLVPESTRLCNDGHCVSAATWVFLHEEEEGRRWENRRQHAYCHTAGTAWVYFYRIPITGASLDAAGCKPCH